MYSETSDKNPKGFYFYIYVGKEKNLRANSLTQNQHSTENTLKT